MARYSFYGTWNKPDWTFDPDRTWDTNFRRTWEAFGDSKTHVAVVGAPCKMKSRDCVHLTAYECRGKRGVPDYAVKGE